MQIGTDGSVQTPDPDVVTTLDDDDVRAIILALTAVLQLWEGASEPPEQTPVEAYRRALAKFERIRDDQGAAATQAGQR